MERITEAYPNLLEFVLQLLPSDQLIQDVLQYLPDL